MLQNKMPIGAYVYMFFFVARRLIRWPQLTRVLTNNFLGNRLLHSLTIGGAYSLRIDLEDFEDEKRYAVYDQFVVGSEDYGFHLTVGGYSGNAGKILPAVAGSPNF